MRSHQHAEISKRWEKLKQYNKSAKAFIYTVYENTKNTLYCVKKVRNRSF